MAIVLNAKKSLSSYQLSRDLELSQMTAWRMQQRIRSAMTTDEGRLLQGIIEMDETYVGGKPRYKNSRNNRGGRRIRRRWAPAACFSDSRQTPHHCGNLAHRVQHGVRSFERRPSSQLVRYDNTTQTGGNRRCGSAGGVLDYHAFFCRCLAVSQRCSVRIGIRFSALVVFSSEHEPEEFHQAAGLVNDIEMVASRTSNHTHFNLAVQFL